MGSHTFLQDLATVMLVAGMVTVLFHKFKQPVVLGYILAGVIIGPYTPKFLLIQDKHSIEIFSELGVIFLMFSLGLEFSLRKLRRVGLPAFIAATLEIALMFWAGYGLGGLFGWSTMDRIFLGAILSISSTTIIIKALGEMGLMKEKFAQLIFGVLIIEDILGIAMIALLSGLAIEGGLSIGGAAVTLGKLGLFLTVVMVAGLILAPRLTAYVARFRSDEMLLITVLALCFGVSLLTIQLGYSVALGAFLIGAILAESREIHRIERLIEPLRDMFSAVFFVAIGMLIDPAILQAYWLPILLITVVVVVGKVVSCSLGAFIGGNDARTSLKVGTGLAQIGEFSFIIATLGASMKVTSGFLYPIAVAVSALTTLLTPYLIRSADGMVTVAGRLAPASWVNTLRLYTRWVGSLAGGGPSFSTKLIRNWVAQMAINVALITAVFVAAGYVSQLRPEWLSNLSWTENWRNITLWLTAALVCLPMFIATVRKLQALGMLVAELKVRQAAAGEKTAAIRALISLLIPLIGTVVLAIYVLVLSSILLPSMKVMLALFVIAAALSWLLRRWFIRVYSKAQIALHETFAAPAAPLPGSGGAPQALSEVLTEAGIERVTIAAGSKAAGRMIRELNLRSLTGATIVLMDRASVRMVNPGADEELQVNDQVTILGAPEQILAAKAYFLEVTQLKDHAGPA